VNHPVKVDGYSGSLKELAKAVGHLRYDKLAEFLRDLKHELVMQQIADVSRGRQRLAEQLRYAHQSLGIVWTHVRIAWKISEPYESEKKE
jgi:hypothetical protein